MDHLALLVSSLDPSFHRYKLEGLKVWVKVEQENFVKEQDLIRHEYANILMEQHWWQKNMKRKHFAELHAQMVDAQRKKLLDLKAQVVARFGQAVDTFVQEYTTRYFDVSDYVLKVLTSLYEREIKRRSDKKGKKLARARSVSSSPTLTAPSPLSSSKKVTGSYTRYKTFERNCKGSVVKSLDILKEADLHLWFKREKEVCCEFVKCTKAKLEQLSKEKDIKLKTITDCFNILFQYAKEELWELDQEVSSSSPTWKYENFLTNLNSSSSSHSDSQNQKKKKDKDVGSLSTCLSQDYTTNTTLNLLGKRKPADINNLFKNDFVLCDILAVRNEAKSILKGSFVADHVSLSHLSWTHVQAGCTADIMGQGTKQPGVACESMSLSLNLNLSSIRF